VGGGVEHPLGDAHVPQPGRSVDPFGSVYGRSASRRRPTSPLSGAEALSASTPKGARHLDLVFFVARP